MTMEGRPNVTRTVSTTRKVQYQIPAIQHMGILCIWLRKIYPEFRGFSDNEFKFTFDEDGNVDCEAYKEENKERA